MSIFFRYLTEILQEKPDDKITILIPNLFLGCLNNYRNSFPEL